MTLVIILVAVILITIIAVFVLHNEQAIVEKAQKSKNMFNFYHMLALMTSPTYKGYVSTPEEDKAMKEFLNGESEYETHPIGTYFKMRKELSEMLRGVGNISFVPSELGIGLTVMLLFIGSVVLGVMFC